MKSTCLVCFTVELNSETLYIFNILRNRGRVVLPGHEPTPNSEMEKKKKTKEKANPQIIKAFKRSFHYSKPQLLIFSPSLAAVSWLPTLDFHAPQSPSENIPTEQEVKSIPGQRGGRSFGTVFSWFDHKSHTGEGSK